MEVIKTDIRDLLVIKPLNLPGVGELILVQCNNVRYSKTSIMYDIAHNNSPKFQFIETHDLQY